MVKRWPTHCLCAALLLFASLALTMAKPPDLPLKQTDDCEECQPGPEYGRNPVPEGAIEVEDEAQPIDMLGTWMTEMVRSCGQGVESWFACSKCPLARFTRGNRSCAHCSHAVKVVAGPVSFTEVVAAAEEPGDCEACEAFEGTTCPCMRACCHRFCEAVTFCCEQIQSCVSGTFSPGAASDDGCKMAPSACPHLRDQAASPCVPPASLSLHSPLENLTRLEKARKMFRSAEQCAHAGQRQKASDLYQKVQYLVPGSRWAQMAESRVKELSDDHAAASEEQEQEPKPAINPYTCPYLIKKNAAKNEPKAEPAALGTVLDNLKLLMKTEKIFEKAEQCLKEGRTDEARHLFHKVHHLCPGGPLARLASRHCAELDEMCVQARALMVEADYCVLAGNFDTARLLYEQLLQTCQCCPTCGYCRTATENLAMMKSMEKPAASSAAASEEQEMPADENDNNQSAAPCVEQRVAELLEGSQRALTDGRYREAQKLAHQAQELDPECVAANALVYKMHLLIQLEEKRSSKSPGKQKRKSAAAPTTIQPRMPAVDPRIVIDFDAVLNQEEAKSEPAETEGTFSQILCFMQCKTGVRVQVTSCGSVRVRSEVDMPCFSGFLCSTVDGLHHVLERLSLPMPLEIETRRNEIIIHWCESNTNTDDCEECEKEEK